VSSSASATVLHAFSVAGTFCLYQAHGCTEAEHCDSAGAGEIATTTTITTLQGNIEDLLKHMCPRVALAASGFFATPLHDLAMTLNDLELVHFFRNLLLY